MGVDRLRVIVRAPRLAQSPNHPTAKSPTHRLELKVRCGYGHPELGLNVHVLLAVQRELGMQRNAVREVDPRRRLLGPEVEVEVEVEVGGTTVQGVNSHRLWQWQ